MAQMTNLYDTSKCTACRGCQVACKNWNQLPAVIEPFKGNYQTHDDTNGDTYTIVRMIENQDPARGLEWNFLKYQCMHCENPACLTVCPRDAYTKSEYGATIHDPDKCIGCRYCSQACPFGIPKHRARTDKVTKCTLCADRVAAGHKPACVETCAPAALMFGERDELIEVAQERVKYLRDNGYPNATVYGLNELGGLNKLYILTDVPEKFGLPSNPQTYGTIDFWQNWIQPYAGWLIPLALAGSAMSFVTTRLLAKKYGTDEEHQEHSEGGQSDEINTGV